MPRLLPCIHRLETGRPCGELSPQSRCPEHRRVYEKNRKESEPWRHFYDDPRWKRTRREVLRRDGFRCTFAIGGRRCNTDVESLLEVHHEKKLRELWRQAGKPQRGGPGWDRFVQMGCDKRLLRTLCTEHHKYVDNTGFRDGITRSGTPGDRATSQHRRHLRQSKRRTKKMRNTATRDNRRRRPYPDDE